MTNKRKQYPSQARLRELFDYDPDGELVWKKTLSKRAVEGSVAGSKKYNSENRFVYDVGICGSVYKGVRLIWIWHYGDIPDGCRVYTKNGKHWDTRIGNLECGKSPVSHFAPKSGGSSEYKGVYVRESGSFRSEFEGADLGTFTSELAAARAYDIAAEKKYGSGGFIGNDVAESIDVDKYRAKATGNAYNAKKSRGSQSKHMGVSIYKRDTHKKWYAKCRRKFLGSFHTEEQAARAYNIAAYEHYGEQAVLNDIPDPLGRGDIF